jgi:hypothetical protein
MEKSPITGEYDKVFNPQARMMQVEIAIAEALDQLVKKFEINISAGSINFTFNTND